MGSVYTDTLLINCSRKSGVEARSGNNTENAIWTNSLNQSVRLDVGDKVEMESVFINEVGSANPSTIEFSGKKKGGRNAINKIPTYTNTQKLQPYDLKKVTYDARYRLGKYRQLSTTEISGQTIPIQDNIAPLIYGYYITANEFPQYLQQPRNFALSYTRGVIPDSDTRKIIYRRDDRIADGRSPFNTNSKMFCFDDYHEVGFDDLKMRVDNSRFTLFVKDDVYYDHTIDGSESQYPIKSKNGIFSEATYFRVRDRLDIKVDKGFNTPSAIAEQITRQLTETLTPESFEIIEGTEDVVEYNRLPNCLLYTSDAADE